MFLYVMGISLVMFVMAISIKDDKIIIIAHGVLIVILVVFNVLFKYFKATGKLIYMFIYVFFLWGIIRALIFPERFVSNTPLISILFFVSVFITLNFRNAILLYGLCLLSLIICFIKIPEINLITYSVTYANICVLCLFVININKKNRKKLYDKTNQLLLYEKKLESDIEKKLDENLLLVSQLENILKYSSYISKDSYNSEEDFLRDIFKKAFKLCKCSNCASIFIINNDKIKYVSTIGYDIGLLNKIAINRNTVNELSDKIEIVYNTNKKYKEETKNKNFHDNYFDITKNVKESLTSHVKLSKTKVIGISFDIRKGTERFFTQNDERTMGAIQTIIKFYYLNDKYNSLQMRFKNDIIYSLINFLEIHDEYTKGHSIKVANYSRSIAIQMKLSDKVVEEIYWAGLLHDIGKILISTDILNKPNKLTDEEYEIIKTHPLTAVRALSWNPELKNISNIILSHHERWDGKGYPNGINGEEIPIESRILAVADAYEAMKSMRVYKIAKTNEEAIEELIRCSGTQFDPEVIKAFLEIKDSI